MHGLNQLTAADHTVTIAGRTYRLSPLTLADYGEIENRILAKRPDPLAVVREKFDGLTESQQQFLLGRAYDRAAAAQLVTAEELRQWRDTPEGICYRFWLMVRKSKPEITLEEASELLRQAIDQHGPEIRRRMDEVNALPVGNSSGRTRQPATRTPSHPCRGIAGPAS